MELFLFFTNLLQRFRFSMEDKENPPSLDGVQALTLTPLPYRLVALSRQTLHNQVYINVNYCKFKHLDTNFINLLFCQCVDMILRCKYQNIITLYPFIIFCHFEKYSEHIFHPFYEWLFKSNKLKKCTCVFFLILIVELNSCISLYS